MVARTALEISRILGSTWERRRRKEQYVSLTIPPEHIDARTKGFWHPGPAETLEDFAAARHRLFGGAFTWPVLVAKRSAIAHNLAELAAFCVRQGLEFAPHGKTTMAPSLFQEQLDAGAWGITAATANQVLAYRSFGVPRVLLANELLDPTALRWIAGEEIDSAADAGASFVVAPDTRAGVDARAPARGLGYYPGAFTPTGVGAAWELGASAVKVFPAGAVGPRYLKEQGGPFRDIALLPTGGVGMGVAGDYIAAGAIAVGVGGPLVGDALDGGSLDALSERARRLIAAVAGARS
jgi:hypothetical protein